MQHRLAAVLALALMGGSVACRKGASILGGDGSRASVDDAGAPDAAAAVAEPASTQGLSPAPIAQPADKPMLGITAFVATVYKEPRDTAKKLGYLRVGSRVARSAEPVSKQGCPGGWYEIFPKGYVCAGKDATTDLDEPILKAAAKATPDLKLPMPYRYAFVRAVLPMYLRVPTRDEQIKSEFKLEEHLAWFKDNGADASRVTLGADDVAVDERGVPLKDKRVGELGLGRSSTEMPVGALLGGTGDDDPIPFWLEGGKRLVPNISDFQVPDYAAFADRARRHTGFALIGSFPTGPESLERRFAITTDLRLVPATKIKPDSGSPWHGLELEGDTTLPLAFVRGQGAKFYAIKKGKVSAGEAADFRAAVPLTGKMRTVEGVKYYRTRDRRWLSQQDVGLAIAPATWPEDAEKGQKWVEVSITNQTLVLWEGKKPIYATLVSTGKAGLDDPKTTTATIRGTFKIRNKHITATMDSNESTAVGGKAETTANDAPASREGPAAVRADDDDDAPRKRDADARGKGKTAQKDAKGGAKKDAKAKADGPSKKGDATRTDGGKAAEEYVPHKGDGMYGVTKRRGEGTFVLRDVPYIQYFAKGYALHGAYWHDVFGTPRSHGCINLSPVDAHRIFLWTDPPVPEGWHAINTGEELGEGTTVIVHE